MQVLVFGKCVSLLMFFGKIDAWRCGVPKKQDNVDSESVFFQNVRRDGTNS